MLRTTGIYFIILVMILVKCFLPDEKPEIIPFPLQSVSDKGDFTFNKATLISVENEKQAMIARELTDLFTLSAGFTPEIKIQDKRANIIFRTDRELAAEHYKLNIAPSCILIKASGQKGFFYAMQTLRFLLPPAINSQTQVENIQWNVPGMTILDGPRYSNRTVAIHTPFTLISKDNLKELIDHLAMLKINRLHFTQEVHDTTPEGQQKMKENFITSIVSTWSNSISEYFKLLQEYPIKLVSLILDLAIVIFIVVKMFQIAKGSRALQLIKGIILFILITWISGILNLTIVHSVLTAFLPSGVIALVVIFQPEIRRGLEQIGTNKFTNLFGMDKSIETKTREDIYKIVIAVEELAKTKTGALIVIQRDISLSDIISTGIEMNSEISPQLLVNIFVPKTPLHDGAVVINNNRIAAAACILPLANNTDISKELGTRHRAAVGISKEYDAIAIVVSEESGKISIAKDGTLIVDVKEEALKKILIKNIITNRLDEKEKNKLARLKNIQELKKKDKEESKENKEADK